MKHPEPVLDTLPSKLATAATSKCNVTHLRSGSAGRNLKRAVISLKVCYTRTHGHTDTRTDGQTDTRTHRQGDTGGLRPLTGGSAENNVYRTMKCTDPFTSSIFTSPSRTVICTSTGTACQTSCETDSQPGIQNEMTALLIRM